MFNHKYRYIFVALLSLYTFVATSICDVYTYFKIEIEWYYALCTIFLITLCIWEANRFIKPYFKRRFLKQESKIPYLIFFFISGNFIALFVPVFFVYLISTVFHNEYIVQNANPYKLNIIYGSLINLLFHLLNAIIFFFSEYKRQWSESEELRRMRTEAEIQLVKNQVNPHFLFNNLNVLSSMLIKDNPEANLFVEQFSKVYRSLLKNNDQELVSLTSELDLIKAYVFLLNKRFDQGIRVDISIPEKYNDWHIVPAAIQMLIENAVKHNVVSSARPLNIHISANGNETLTVKNNLQLRLKPEPSTRIGLQNIEKRYQLISGKDIHISESSSFFEVTLPLLQVN